MTATVWILARDEMHEGGDVIGVYATRDAAKGDFLVAVQRLPFEVHGAWRDEDTGAIRLEAGCDWVSLEPHDVQQQTALPGGTR